MSEHSDDVLKIGEWSADPSLDTIRRGTETQKLEPRTMRLLVCLASAPGSVISVDRLLTDVWTGVIVGPASVYQAVSQLRRLLGDTDEKPTYIANVPRKGYRLIAPVERLPRAQTFTKEAAPPIEATAPGNLTAGSAAPTPLLPVVSPAPVKVARRARWAVVGATAVLVIGLAAAVIWKISQRFDNFGAGNASIVVLPFVDLTANKSDQPFCDGLTEELSNWLAQIPTLRVVARTSAFAFRNQGQDVRKIGAELNTNHVLEGSIRRSGDKIRITVQLIDARTGYHLWSENFDRSADDTVAIQEDISRSVAQRMQIRITSDVERQFIARRTNNPRAYRAYLLGRHAAQESTAQSNDQAIQLFQETIAAEPTFAPAYVQLARAKLNEAFFKKLPIGDVAGTVESLISSALHLDDRLSLAYAARGSLRSEQGRIVDALADLERALALNADEFQALAELGRIAFESGYPRDAVTYFERAIVLDPMNPLLHTQLCSVWEDMARYDDAERACMRARTLQPDKAWPSEALTWLAESRGQIAAALKWNADVIKKDNSNTFDFYWSRASLFLSVHLTRAATEAIDRGRTTLSEDEDAKAAMIRVVFGEGGAEALRNYLSHANLEKSSHASTLIELAYAHMLLGEYGVAKDLIARGLAAPQVELNYADAPWYARGTVPTGATYRLDLAVICLGLGDSECAEREARTVLDRVDKMIMNGTQRHGTFEIRAKANALLGKNDESIRDLQRAVALGWRAAWSAVHEPYFLSLRSRQDFQLLVSNVELSNGQAIRGLEDTLAH